MEHIVSSSNKESNSFPYRPNTVISLRKAENCDLTDEILATQRDHGEELDLRYRHLHQLYYGLREKHIESPDTQQRHQIACLLEDIENEMAQILIEFDEPEQDNG